MPMPVHAIGQLFERRRPSSSHFHTEPDRARDKPTEGGCDALQSRS